MDLFSFGSSDDLNELEQGLLEMQKVMDQVVLAFGLTILRIEEEGLWHQSGLPNLWTYRVEHLDQLAIPKQTISTRRRIARGYMENKTLLEGIDLTDKLSKLIHLSRAIEKHGRNAALKHFQEDSYREWEAFVGAATVEKT